MDMYKIKWTRLQAEIFRYLCIKSGDSFNLRGLARPLKVSPTAVSNALRDLEKEELIKVKKSETMNLMSIEFNRDNYKAFELKRTENLKLIYESGLVDFLEEKFPGSVIILFGSYSRGEDTTASDIDIAIIGAREKEIKLTSFDKLLERTIFINFYPDWNIKNNNLKNNILNGIVLRGSVEI
ncbi:nucleotidyltransferase domain-containing protein [Candidatus Pacearchaeota archaeon]|nr:nucleotidyltransferase domain-containing protein [Candidatus Pacearchaeota archaeon]